jgi:hypothetical protein
MRSLIIRLPDTIKPSDHLGVEDASPIVYAVNDHNVAMILLSTLEAFEEHGYLDKPAPHSPSSD